MRERYESEIVLLIPTLNEEEGIGSVVSSTPRNVEGLDVDIFVIDGGSEDRTREIAEGERATVIEQSYRGGKGAALQQAFNQIDAKIYVTIDGDGTYRPEEMQMLVSPIISGEADHVIGSRFEKRVADSMSFLTLFGNHLFNIIVRTLYKADIEDMLSGYRALSGYAVNRLSLKRQDFGIEADMSISTINSSLKMAEVPVTYHPRKGNSNLHPLYDGLDILHTIVQHL